MHIVQLLPATGYYATYKDPTDETMEYCADVIMWALFDDGFGGQSIVGMTVSEDGTIIRSDSHKDFTGYGAKDDSDEQDAKLAE